MMYVALAVMVAISIIGAIASLVLLALSDK